MSSFKDISKIKAKSLIELIISVFLLSIIILAAVNLLSVSIDFSSLNKNSNSNLIDFDYSINYMLNELDQSEYILDKSYYRINGDNWLNLIFIKVDNNKVKDKYNKITYTLNRNNEIVRKSFSSSSIDHLKTYNRFQGNNALLSNVESFKCNFYQEKMLLEINIKFIDDEDIYTVFHNVKGELVE